MTLLFQTLTVPKGWKKSLHVQNSSEEGKVLGLVGWIEMLIIFLLLNNI